MVKKNPSPSNLPKAKNLKTKMRKEYDLSQGVRGKYTKAYHQGSNVVVLAPDVAERFPNAESVNQALRSLANLMDGKHQSH